MSPEAIHGIIKAIVLAGGMSIIISVFILISRCISRGIDKLKK